MDTRAGGIVVCRRLWRAGPALLVVAGICVPVGLVALVGLAVDGRVITGSPAWLKPLKFAASIATYCATVAWLIASVPAPSRWLRGAGAVVAGSLAVELAIIVGQAARGTTSHFNAATPLDSALFGAMGVMILALLLASAAVAVGVARARFDDRAWGWALKLGMGLTVVGATTGGFMVRPTPAQAERARATGSTPTSGAHTVGGPDGGRGLPLVGWSCDHGDLRAPHFFGLHAVQVVPLVTWLLLRRRPRPERTRLALVALVAASYAALVGLLTVQALAGRPVLALDAWTLGALGGWAAVSAAGYVALDARGRSRAGSPLVAVGA